MKKIIISILLFFLFLFSYLYDKRIDELKIYSLYAVDVVDLNLETFDICLYSNKSESIYVKPNYISFQIKLNDEKYKLNLKSCNSSKLNDSLYMYKYTFDKIDVDENYYNSEFILLTSENTLSFNLGKLYFTLKNTQYLEYDLDYNMFNNISKISTEFSKNQELNLVSLNSLDCMYTIESANIYNYTKLIIYPINNLFIKQMVLKVNSTYYKIENSTFSSLYLLEAFYENI